MRAVTLLGHGKAIKSLVEASGARIAWDESADSFARTRVGLADAVPAALVEAHGLHGRVQHFVCRDPWTDTIVVSGHDPVRAAHLAFSWAAGHARQRIAVGDPRLLEPARAVAKDYPQIALDERVPEDIDVLLGSDAGLLKRFPDAPLALLGRDAALFVGGAAAAAMMLEHIHEGMAADRILRNLRGGAL